MSTEKLSELSKPAAWVLGTPSCKHLTADAEYADWYLEHGSTADPLYSQEYVSALLARIAELEIGEIKPEGLKLMIEAIGAHGYIVGCLVQGRQDLALEESRKWAEAFSQAAEQSNG